MKTVKRILMGLLGLVMGLVILLAGSIAIDFAVGTERINAVTNTTIPGQNGGPDVRAYVATPPGEVLRSLPGPVLGIFGGADNSIPVEDVHAFEAALNQAGIPNEITLYEGQPHAFVTDIESIRSGGVQGQSWAQMLEFFEENLKQGATSQNFNPPQTYKDSFDWEYYLIVAYENAFGTASHHHLHP
jgi:hypothetical protein